MDAGDGDTLARSQLALLYKLGLLQQDAGEVENDPHAFLNRLPPPAASEIARKNASFQSSGEGAWKDTSARSPYAAVGHYEPVIRVQTRAPPSPVHSVGAVRVPLSPRPVSPPAGRSTSRFSFASSSRLPDESPRVVTQRWFGVWKCHVESRGKLVQADTKRRLSIKRRVLHEWTAAVYRRRLLDARCRQLRCWKAKRALHMWARYTALHGRVAWFLSTRGRSSALLNRLRRARGFERWRVFVQWSGRQRYLHAKAQAVYSCTVLRKLWLAWRVDVFQSRRRRGMYRRFMGTIRSEMVERQSRWELATERYARHASERLARLLRRWRLFNDARQRDHLCAWRVRSLLRRGRYFAIWVDALLDKRHIGPLRLRVQRRVKRSSLWAWHATARAIVMSRSSTLWHPQAICTRYLTVWKWWSYDARRSSHATMVLRAKRQRGALRTMRAWTVAHGKFSRLCSKADAIARRRILRHVWENGWLVRHWQRQLDRTRTRQVRRLTQTRLFGLWRLAWSICFEWRDKKRIARSMGFKAAVQSVWAAWQDHTARRRLHKRHMIAASRHHRHRLYLTGLVAFAKRVDTKSVYTTTARRIRLEQRRRLIRRIFSAWRNHTQKTGSLQLRMHQYLTRPTYAHSLWNPMRRRWRRWQEFTHLRKSLHRLSTHHRIVSTRGVFQAWQRRAVIRSRSRVQRSRHQNRRCRAAFSAWTCRVREWRRKEGLSKRAQDFHRRVIEVKTLRAWCAVVCGRLRRLRRQYERLQSRYRQQATRWALRQWHTKLRQRLAIQGLESRRRLAWLQCCWLAWSRYHAQQAKHKRKLRYYRQIYGLYPACSPLRRQWSHWKSQALLGAAASKLRRRCGWRCVRDCFSAWRTFRTAKLALREWHTLSVIAGATNNDLGKRLRLFRLQCWRRQVRRMLSGWAQFCHCRQREQVRLEMTHRRMLRDVLHAEAKRRKRRRCLLRLWFQRWRRRQLASLYNAEQWHRQRHCQHILHAWWRQVIHSKQERLLQDARHTVEMMSAHRMAQQTRRVASDSRRYASDGIKAVPAVRSRATSTPAKRPPPPVKRMVDPDEYASTYRQQQQRGRPLSQSHKDITPCRSEMASSRPTHRPVQRHPGPVRESEELLCRVTAPIRERHRVASVGVQELPLFDEEPHNQAPVNCDHTDLLPRRPDPPPAQTEGGNDGDPLLSLESIAAMDPYSPAKQPSQTPQQSLQKTRSTAPPLRTTVAPPQRFPASDGTVHCSQTPPQSEPILYAPSQSLRPRASAGGTRAVTKVPEKRVAAKQELVEILEISSQRPAQSQVSMFRTVLHGMQAEKSGSREDINVDSIVRVVIKYYVLAAQRFAASSPLERWGFCMLRDLGLFVNGFFLEDMEKAIKRVPTDDLGQMLRNLLCEFTRNHPHYAPHNASQIESAERKLDPLGWLVRSHLLPRHGHVAMATATDPPARPFWIRHELPQEVVLSLPKLIRCMKKYQKPLETFFAWRPERSASGSSASRRRSMDAANFLSLMKHCNVYPQLFDRRELEDAVACAGARHHGGGGQLDMPQFVEALVRCALRLKWADVASDSSSAQLVVVVKFLMLIFAMEGRGSMLTKRSQDLDAVLRFLQRQQDTTTKSAKLRQFQALLRAESSSKPRIPKHTSNVFRAAMANPARTWQGSGVQGSLNAARPAHRSARSPHQIESPESSVTRGQDLRRMRLTASSPVPFPDCLASDDVEKDSDERQSPWSHELEYHGSASQLNPVNSSLAIEHDTRGRTLDDDRRTCKAANESESPALDPSAQRTESITLTRSPIVSGPTHLDNAGLRAPMDRDAFLNDILSSLHDVELLLQHSDIRRPSKNATSPAELDVELQSEPFSAAYPERYAVLTTGQLSSGINVSDNSESSLPTDDISIRDPLLDHLTFADRFSESPDWQSHLSIADLAVHGIHAAFPSATHVRTSVQTGELDDLTDPQRTAAYLRAENYGGLHENWLC